MIVKSGSKWVVKAENGRPLGSYDTREAAEKRLREIEFFKQRDQQGMKRR